MEKLRESNLFDSDEYSKFAKKFLKVNEIIKYNDSIIDDFI